MDTALPKQDVEVKVEFQPYFNMYPEDHTPTGYFNRGGPPEELLAWIGSGEFIGVDQ
jgi:hypothetical protein